MTNSIVPANRPEMGRHAVEAMLTAAGIAGPGILARRGYYRDSMGKPGVQEWGVYDDALIYCSSTAFLAVNANVDPTRHKPGVAQLRPGVWKFREGIHNRSKDPAKHPHYRALIQGEEFEVYREGTEEYETGHVHPVYGRCLGAGVWRGWFGINQHCGSEHSTSSEGCLTVYPPQWQMYIELVLGDLQRHGLLFVPTLVSERGDG